MNLRGEIYVVQRTASRNLLFMIVFCLAPLFSLAQVTQPHRFERKQKGSEDHPTIIPLAEEGLIIVQNKEKYNEGKRLWEVTILDTLLQEKKTLELNIENRYTLLGYEYAKGYFYLLFSAGDTGKSTLELFEFSTSGEQLGHFDVKPELDFKLTYFIKVGEKIVFGGYFSKEPVILILELKTNLLKVVPGFFQKDTELVDLRSNQNKTFNVVLIDRSTKAEKKLIFRTFDETGELLLEDIVPIDDKRSLQKGLSTTLEHEELVVMGTWGHKQDKQSTGFFILHIDPFNEQKIHYFYFAKLSHYLDRFKPNKAKHIKDKAEDEILAGNDPDFSEYVMPFKIEENKEGFLLLAEVYYPVSNMNQYSGPNGYGGIYGSPYYVNPYSPNYYYPGRMYNPYPFSNTNKSYTEIDMVQTVLLALDHKGNLLWDQSMKTDDVIDRLSLEQLSDFYYSPAQVTLLCKKKEGELRIKTTDLADDESKEVIEKIKLKDVNDEFRSEKEDIGGLNKWYNNSFYVWGYQTIRNFKNEDRLRDVFYINKVVVGK